MAIAAGLVLAVILVSECNISHEGPTAAND
jgi:hypothetical protein